MFDYDMSVVSSTSVICGTDFHVNTASDDDTNIMRFRQQQERQHCCVRIPPLPIPIIFYPISSAADTIHVALWNNIEAPLMIMFGDGQVDCYDILMM